MYNVSKKRKNIYSKKNKRAYKKAPRLSKIQRYSTPKGEVKTVDYGETNTTQLISTPQYYCLNGLARGTGYWNRIGKKIAMKSLRLRIQLRDYPEWDGVAGTCMLRFLVYYDRQANQLPSAFGDVIQQKNALGTVDTPRMGFLNMDNSERYIILSDTIVPLFSNKNQSTDAPSQQYIAMIDGVPKNFFDIYIKLNQLETVYGGDDSSDTSINTGAVYMMLFSDLPGGGSNVMPMYARFISRLRYYDY